MKLWKRIFDDIFGKKCEDCSSRTRRVEMDKLILIVPLENVVGAPQYFQPDDHPRERTASLGSGYY